MRRLLQHFAGHTETACEPAELFCTVMSFFFCSLDGCASDYNFVRPFLQTCSQKYLFLSVNVDNEQCMVSSPPFAH